MPRFGWKAVYVDAILKQDWISGVGDSFSEVEKKGKPVRFYVGKNFGVNLETGELLVKGKWLLVGDKDGNPLKPTKLIYFRRVWHGMNVGSGELIKHPIRHFVGYEHNGGIVRLCITQDGKQHMLCIGRENANT